MKYLPSTPLRISGKTTTPAVRLGVSTSDGDIEAPVGYDIESYALASMTGSKVHNAHVEEFAGEGFNFGDIIGVWLVLPADPNLSAAAAQAERAREEKEREEATKKKKGRGAKKATTSAPTKQSDKDDAAAAMLVDNAAAAAAASLPAVSDAELVQNRKFHRHSFLRFYKNGLPLGGASTAAQIASGIVGPGVNAWSDKDVVRATYFPAVSLYMGATVRLNFGPDFWCVPEEVTKGVALAMQQNQQSQAAQAEAASTAAAAAPATAASPSALPPAAPFTPSAAASSAVTPAPSSFRHPLPRPLLTSGLFPHLDASGSSLQLNPKQLAHNVAVAEEARQRGQSIHSQAVREKGTGSNAHSLLFVIPVSCARCLQRRSRHRGQRTCRRTAALRRAAKCKHKQRSARSSAFQSELSQRVAACCVLIAASDSALKFCSTESFCDRTRDSNSGFE